MIDIAPIFDKASRFEDEEDMKLRWDDQHSNERLLVCVVYRCGTQIRGAPRLSTSRRWRSDVQSVWSETASVPVADRTGSEKSIMFVWALLCAGTLSVTSAEASAADVVTL